MDSINANPYYYEGIIKEIEKKKGCARVKYYFNFNVEEYEMLMSVVEKGIDIFSLLKEYFEESGVDVEEMCKEELEEASEVFALPDGK